MFDREGYLLHAIIEEDSLLSLSVRYGISTRKLAKANRGLVLNKRILPHATMLRIPPDSLNISNVRVETDEERDDRLRKEMVKTFCNIFRNEPSEVALFYLGEHNWNLDAAVAEARSDREWADRHMAQTASPLVKKTL